MYWKGGFLDGIGNKEQNLIFRDTTKIDSKGAGCIEGTIEHWDCMQVRRIRGTKLSNLLGPNGQESNLGVERNRKELY